MIITGSNTNVFVIGNKPKTIIKSLTMDRKMFGSYLECKYVADRLIFDIQRYRKILLYNSVSLPNIHYFHINRYWPNNIVIKESYCGNTIIEHYIKNRESSLSYIKEIMNILKRLPKDVYIDSNPRNFTLYKDKIYFVDYIPPIFSFSRVPLYYMRLFNIYSDRSPERNSRRIWRYTNPNGRISKFVYYFKKFSGSNPLE